MTNPEIIRRWVLNIISTISAEPIGFGIGVAVEIGKPKSAIIPIPILIPNTIMLFEPL